MQSPAADPSQNSVPSYKRLAITVAGAVSLGSYEAGVMFEVFDAISQHNRHPETQPEERIFIDVITGASAGGMTAIILAQKLLYEADKFAGPYDNPLYNAWVERIDLEGLQSTHPDEPATHSLLSSDLIEQISYETLMARYGVPMPPAPAPNPPVKPEPAKPHPAIDPARTFRVGVAMTNLDGVDYAYNVQPHGTFGYREYADQRSRAIRPQSADDDTADFWRPLREAAVACGAFPFAFRPQEISRSAFTESVDYPPDHLVKWPFDPYPFAYTDGGVLQNQPLGMAKNLVDLQDQHLGQERRFYLFVSPHEKDPGNRSQFAANDGDYLHMAMQLVEAVVGQSGFRDWITADKVNQAVSLMDSRATGLCQGIVAGVVNVPALQQTAHAILPMLFPADRPHRAPGAKVNESAAAARARLAKQYASEVHSLDASSIPNAANAFLDSMLAFETAAGLGARDTMQIYGMTSTSNELAGADLESFLGFFSQQYRLHDYEVGRTKARQVLQNLGGGLAPIRHTPSLPTPHVDPKFDGLTFASPNLDQAIKQKFQSRLEDRIAQAVLEQKTPGIVLRKAMAWAARKLTGIVLDRIK